jgi:hypothetical protein
VSIKGRMPVGAPSHEPPTIKSGRADGESYRRRQPGQRLDQPAGEALNESTKMGGEGRLEAGSRSKPCAAGPAGGGAASQKGRPSGREAKRGGRSRGQKRWDEGGRSRSSELFIPGPSGEGALILMGRG